MRAPHSTSSRSVTASRSMGYISAAQGRLQRAVLRYDERWRRGGAPPDLAAYLAEPQPEGPFSLTVVTALVKTDLARRFERGERPTAVEYLRRFPDLGRLGDRVLSVVYEEFCLREEFGMTADPEEFCRRYAEWTDSLASQLFYHRDLSQVAGLPTGPPPRFPRVGDRFGEFDLVEEIGRGGDARVFRAREAALARQVVLKVSSDRGREPQILGQLDHDHIVAVHSVLHLPERRLRALCMPYYPGLALDTLIRRIDPARRAPRTARALVDALEAPPDTGADDEIEPKTVLDPGLALPAVDDSTVIEEVIDDGVARVVAGKPWADFPANGRYADAVAWVGRVLARALHYAHLHGIQHRDVKPANVLLTFRRGPQLLDFNLAHDPNSAEEATAALRGGTLPYMAPEQLEAFLDPGKWRKVDARADLYALGLVLREMLTGLPPDLPEPGIPLARAINGLIDRRLELEAIPAPHRTSWFGSRSRSRWRRGSTAAADPSTASDDHASDVAPSDLADGTGEDEPAPIRPVRVPGALESILARCLCHDPEGRYRSAAELADDLDCFLRREPLKHAPNPSLLERLGNWLRRHALAATTATVLFGTSLGWFAANYERLVVAPEDRAAFAAAVAAIERGEPQRVLSLTEPLAAEAPESPLIHFYRAAAWARLGRAPEAAGALQEAWRRDDADRVLHAWGREHPALSTLGYQTSLAILRFRTSDGQSLSSRASADVAGTVRRTLELVVDLQPHNEQAQFDLAAVCEQMDDHDRAQQLLSGLIDAPWSNDPTPGGAARLAGFLLARARVRAKAGIASAGRGAAGGDGVEASLMAGLRDLDRYVRLVERLPSYEPCRAQFVRCETYLALCQIRSLGGRPAEASQACDQARSLLPALEQCYGERPEFVALRQSIETQAAAVSGGHTASASGP